MGAFYREYTKNLIFIVIHRFFREKFTAAIIERNGCKIAVAVYY